MSPEARHPPCGEPNGPRIGGAESRQHIRGGIMWSNLEDELRLLKRECFAKGYRTIQESLERRPDSPEKEAQLRDFRDQENSFFYLITAVIESQEGTGYWDVGAQHTILITAHAIRLLHQMGLPLSIRWNLAKGGRSKEGNLYRATKLVLDSHHEPNDKHHSHWGDDLWDNCYVLLALLEVRPDFDSPEVPQCNPGLNAYFNRHHGESLNWLRQQIADTGFVEKVTEEPWYGPGFYAAAIELLDHPITKNRFQNNEHATIIDTLAQAVKPLVRESIEGKDGAAWDERFAWHAGQLLVTWREKRDVYSSLRELGPLMAKLYDKLKQQQSKNGAWDDKGKLKNPEYVIYYTVRALAACYAMEEDISASPAIRLAHQFLSRIAGANEDSLLVNIKASINAIDAYQKLFGFRFPKVYPNPLVSLTARLNRLGLLNALQKPTHGGEAEHLEMVRADARVSLEDQGKSALERLGINDRLYDSLTRRDDFLAQFTGDPEEIKRELHKFLSSTLTETRSKSSRRLIRHLWRRGDILNFLPLIEHLSLLEQDGAFYKYYRHHLNHEVLLFLLGAYIYFNCATFNSKIDDEIAGTYELRGIVFDKKHLSDEFLFRWKLISTFHDIGYLFEVETTKDNDGNEIRNKSKLLWESFGVIQKFREEFLTDYLAPYISIGNLDGRKKEAQSLIATLGTPPYPGGPIKKESDLFALTTAEQFKDAFTLISDFINPPHIGRDLVRDYFDICRTVDVHDKKSGGLIRERFLDHGVMSALVLLKTADIQRFELKQLNDLAFLGKLFKYPGAAKVFNDENTKTQLGVQQFYVRFSHVAGAIALHNIYPKLYSQQQCHDFDVI